VQIIVTMQPKIKQIAEAS